MIVKATLEGNSYDRGSYEIEVDGKIIYDVYNMQESPEDACIGRALPTSEVLTLMKQMYQAGKDGVEVTFEEIDNSDDEQGIKHSRREGETMNETFPQWFRRKYDAIHPKLPRREVAARASRISKISTGYVIRILLHAGKPTEPQVSPDKIIALAHAVGGDPQEALTTRANVVYVNRGDMEVNLKHGGSIVIRGRILESQSKVVLAEVVDVLVNYRR